MLERLLLTLLLAWLGLAALVYSSAEHEVVEVLDSELAQYARVLQMLAATRDPGEWRPGERRLAIGAYSEQRPEEGHRYERKLRFQVWAADGELLMHSADLSAVDPVPAEAGYGVEADGDYRWRTFTLLGGPGDIRVRVAERDDVRGEMVGEIVLNQLAPGLLALPVFALLVWIVVGQGLQPLRRVAGEVARRSPDQLTPLRQQRVPAEVRPLVEALNRLFERLQTAFERERRFIADAAHELRTPLAAIKTQAQAALAIDDPAERRRALNNIVRGVDRATHLEAQLLTLARLEPEAQGALRQVQVEPAPLARQVLAELAPAAIAREVELGLEAGETGPLRAEPELLAILLRNLVDNGIRHTPAGGSVSVGLGLEGTDVLLTVDDSGPGIPDAEQARVFERFYRGEGRTGAGSGLGLSIVRRIVELHGGSVSLGRAEAGGVRVRVRLPGGGHG